MTEEKISVIMGIYNCADTLPEAINSIVNQTYTNWQLIMCDDCSTDDTYEIAKGFAEQYPDKMILIRNEKNMRLAYSLNHCLEYATGEYVARMDGDDISVPNRFEKQVAYLKEHPEIHLVGTQMQQFNETELLNIESRPEHTDRWTLHKIIPFNHATILTYKYVYDKLGGYTVASKTARCEDYDLWFRFFAKGFCGDNIQEPLYMVRENYGAIKRRTFKSRWRAFSVTRDGYKLLGYPKRWLVKEFFVTCIKSFVPSNVAMLYRKMQKRRETKL